jgi:hypothetical protein
MAVAFALAFALIAGAGPVALAAQEAGAGGGALRGPTTELGITVGAVAPLGTVARVEQGASLGLSSSFAAAAGVTRWLDGRWGLAADGLWATGGPDVTRAPEEGPGSPGTGGGEDDQADDAAGATYLTGTVRVLYRLPSLSGVVEPRFGIGLGVRHLTINETGSFGAVSETDPAAVLSGAVRSPISGRAALTVELRDVLSFADAGDGADGASLQNDVVVLVGVSVRP